MLEVFPKYLTQCKKSRAAKKPRLRILEEWDRKGLWKGLQAPAYRSWLLRCCTERTDRKGCELLCAGLHSVQICSAVITCNSCDGAPLRVWQKLRRGRRATPRVKGQAKSWRMKLRTRVQREWLFSRIKAFWLSPPTTSSCEIPRNEKVNKKSLSGKITGFSPSYLYNQNTQYGEKQLKHI